MRALWPITFTSQPISSSSYFRSKFIKHFFIDIAPAPIFVGLEGFDDRVICRLKVLRGVFVF